MITATQNRPIDILWRALLNQADIPFDPDAIDENWVDWVLQDAAEDDPAVRAALATATYGDLRGLATDLRDDLHTAQADAASWARWECCDD